MGTTEQLTENDVRAMIAYRDMQQALAEQYDYLLDATVRSEAQWYAAQRSLASGLLNEREYGDHLVTDAQMQIARARDILAIYPTARVVVSNDRTTVVPSRYQEQQIERGNRVISAYVYLESGHIATSQAYRVAAIVVE